MKPESQTKVLAELDNIFEAFPRDPALGKERGGILLPYKYEQLGTRNRFQTYPDYIGSYDAIIPLIQKQSEIVQDRVKRELSQLRFWIKATPAQLCEALLKAVGKWTEKDL